MHKEEVRETVEEVMYIYLTVVVVVAVMAMIWMEVEDI